MNFFGRIDSRAYACVLDFGADEVSVLIADKTDRGVHRILGFGQSRSVGVERGEIRNIGDAVEAVVEALTRAQTSAGVRVQALFYNLDEPCIESRRPMGSKILDGEGEVQPSDIKQAVQAARRLVGDYEKTIVYAKETDFIIDDRDPVGIPLGIFGHKISVRLETLLARASHCDAWKKIMRRSGLKLAHPVLSGLSTTYGVLTQEERDSKTYIVWDLGKDLLTGVVYGDRRLRAYRVIANDNSLWDQSATVILALTQSWLQEYEDVAETLLAGDLSSDAKILATLKEGVGISVRQSFAVGVEAMPSASHASLAGLLKIAHEMKSKWMRMRPEKSLMVGVKERAESFLNDYF